MSIYVGHVDLLSPSGVLEGWAVNTEAPKQAARLELLLDEEAEGEFECLGHRPDVLAAGHGTAVAGFRHQIHKRFHDGVSRAVSFRPAGGGKAFRLTGLQTVWLAKPIAGEVALSAERDRLEGWVATTRGGGWPILLEFRVDGAPFAIERLTGSTDAGVRVRFSVPLPRPIVEDRRNRKIEVRLLGSEDHLSGSPLWSRVVGVVGSVGSFDDLRGSLVRGWAFDARLGRPPSLDVFCDDVKIMQIHCDSPRQDIFQLLGARTAGFHVRLPPALLGSSPRKLHLQFPDGSPVPGGPKHFNALDLALLELERKLASRMLIAEGEVLTAEAFEDEVRCVGRILVAPPPVPNVGPYRVEATDLSREILERALFSLPPAEAIEIAINLSLAGINICRNPDDLHRILPILQLLPKDSPQVYGLIDLERQRRRPFNRLLLAGVLMSHHREDEAIDMIFESFEAAAAEHRNNVASLGVGLLLRAGRASEAKELLLAHLVK